MSKTILAVDDSASVRQVVSFTLRSAGFDVIEAVNGQEALGKLDRSVNLVITDLNMPVLDGIGLVKGIRSGTTHKYVPVIVLTTESQETKKIEARSAGATGWIVKPFRPEQLLAVVKKLLG
jgi:two-component system chemotaxis response regulator CheY